MFKPIKILAPDESDFSTCDILFENSLFTGDNFGYIQIVNADNTIFEFKPFLDYENIRVLDFTDFSKIHGLEFNDETYFISGHDAISCFGNLKNKDDLFVFDQSINFEKKFLNQYLKSIFNKSNFGTIINFVITIKKPLYFSEILVGLSFDKHENDYFKHLVHVFLCSVEFELALKFYKFGEVKTYKNGRFGLHFSIDLTDYEKTKLSRLLPQIAMTFIEGQDFSLNEVDKSIHKNKEQFRNNILLSNDAKTQSLLKKIDVARKKMEKNSSDANIIELRDLLDELIDLPNSGLILSDQLKYLDEALDLSRRLINGSLNKVERRNFCLRIRDNGEKHISIGYMKLGLARLKEGTDVRKQIWKEENIDTDMNVFVEDLQNLASNQLYGNQFGKALKTFEESYALTSRNMGSYGDFNAANMLLLDIKNLAFIHAKTGLHTKAKKFASQGMEICKKLLIEFESESNQIVLVDSLNKIGEINMMLRRTDLALQNYSQSLEIVDKLVKAKPSNKTRALLADCSDNIASHLAYQEDYKKALNLYTESLQTRRELDNGLSSLSTKLDLRKSLLNIGNIYVLMGRYTKSAHFYKDGLFISTQLNRGSTNPNSKQNLLEDLINLAFVTKGETSALEFFDKGIPLLVEPFLSKLSPSIINRLISVLDSSVSSLGVFKHGSKTHILIQISKQIKVRLAELSEDKSLSSFLPFQY